MKATVYLYAVLLFLLPASARPETVIAANDDRAVPAEVLVTTLEWPPYTGKHLPGGGAVTEAVRQAFDDAGIRTEVLVVPWKRAVAYARDGKFGATAYFPGYHCNHQPGFISSRPIGTGPLGLAERVDADISWKTLDDLASLRVGTVVGYANTPAFDERVEDGSLEVISSLSDVENLLKLGQGKLDAAVVDRYVFEHLMRTESRLAPYAGELRVDANMLETKNLYLCFRAEPEGEALRDLFNAGLRSVDFDAIWRSTLPATE